MNRTIDLRLLFSSTSLKLLVAVSQVIASILYFRNMGAEDFGRIIAFAASIEFILLISIPGVAKVCLKNLANDKFPVIPYKFKILLITVIMLIIPLFIDDFYYICIAAFLCLDNINSLNRSSLTVRRKFNLLVSLDLLRPIISIALIFLTLYYEGHVGIEVYVLSMLLSLGVETLIVIPFVIKSYRKFPPSLQPYKVLLSEAALASGFSYTATSIRKLPVITAGSVLPELSALTSIFMQFYTLVNYLISALMMQISVNLLKREIFHKSTYEIIFARRKLVKFSIILFYILTLILLDQSKSIWLVQIFNYTEEIYFSMFALGLLPLMSFFAQVQFYSLFSKDTKNAYYFIFLNLTGVAIISAIYFFIGEVDLQNFGFITLCYHTMIFFFLLLADRVSSRVLVDCGSDAT